MSMAIPVVPDLPAGSLVTEAEMNQLSSCCTFLLNKPIVRVHDAAGGTSIATAPTRTAIPFNTLDFDPDGTWSSGANTVLTIQTPGWYKVRWGVTVGSTLLATAGSVQSTTGANNPAGSGQASAFFWPGYVAQGTVPGALGGGGLWPFYLWPGDTLQVGCSATGAGESTVTTDAGSFFSLEYVSVQNI